MKQYFDTRNFKIIALSFILAIAVAIAFSEIGHYDFVNFDDGEYVVDNSHVHQGITLDNVLWAFSFDQEAIFFYWTPFTWLSYMLDAQFFGLNARVGHITNAVIHGLNAILLFLLFYRMTGALWKSALVALFFAVHPINVESVVWISERKNVLSTFFWLMTMHAYTSYIRQTGFKRYLPVLAFFICGLLSKPMLVTLPFVLLLMDVWPLKRLQWLDSEIPQATGRLPVFEKSSILSLVLEKLPLFILALISIGVSVFSVHSTSQVIQENMIAYPLRVSNAIVIYIKYIIKLLWPHDLAVFYPFPPLIPIWQVAGAAILLIIISASAILLFKKATYLSVGWFWYLGTLFPVIGIFQSGKWPEMADRWLYIPQIGLFLIFIWGAEALFKRLRYQKIIVTAIFGSILFALTMTTKNQAAYWKDSITLFQQTLKVTENNPLAHIFLGNSLAEKEDYPQALTHYTKALSFDPDNVEALHSTGAIFSLTGRPGKAVPYFKKTIFLSPDYAEAHLNLANALFQTGKIEKAIKHYQKALSLTSSNNAMEKRSNLLLALHNNIGIAFFETGQVNEAILHFKQAILLSPDDVDTHFNLANALVKNQEISAAIDHYKKVLLINPNHIDARNRLKKLSAFQNEFKKAKKQIENQLADDPDNPVFHYQLGLFYKNRGLPDKALESFRTAVNLQPDLWEALYNQALIHAGKKEYDHSIALFKQIVLLQPENASVYYNIACIYSLQDQKADAVDWLQKAIDAGYRNWQQIKNDPDLENLRELPEVKLLMGRHAAPTD